MTLKQEDSLILPHGGKLILREYKEENIDFLSQNDENLQSITLNSWELSDLEMIGIGAFSPLEGFMTKEDYLSVLKYMRLKSGIVWTIPVTLSVEFDVAEQLSIDQNIILKDKEGSAYGILTLKEKYEYDKEYEAEMIYGTKDINHPGVKKLLNRGNVNLAGPITLFKRINYGDLKDYYLDPVQTRSMFKNLGWKKIVGFQTRNPIHRAHEYIQKCALEMVDGLFINPLVGETKSDDIPATTRMETYKILIEKYFPRERTRLAVFPAAMRYAGPREAVFHAIIRKNYGCTHFIVGRDHAGVGEYYGTYDAQKIFEEFSKEEIGIEILKFDHAFYCKKCETMGTMKTCPHDKNDHVHLSGTKVRNLLREGIMPPAEFTRAEVASILINAMRKS
ncbi:sulfate adenylyltransferase [Bacillus thuringiensis]|uniref:sulfate adenylyltransferase n=1 Tax=Bacillus thuringiensis TaxID=1428 RepID=UPI00211D9D4D|nr:sulfate adenylyltransferase [Bacillus thuringiensis]MED3053026.1 sulfate adenylyltransferase [Bacillus thuringiensis]